VIQVALSELKYLRYLISGRISFIEIKLQS